MNKMLASTKNWITAAEVLFDYHKVDHDDGFVAEIVSSQLPG